MENELISDNFNTLLVIPSFITIITVIVVVSFRKWRAILWGNYLIAGLTFSLLLLNILEALTFGNIYKDYDLLLRIYYCATFITSSFILCLSEKLCSFKAYSQNHLYILLFFINVILIYFIQFTDVVVAGAQRNIYTISRIQGDYYWLFQIYTLICISLSPILIFNSIFFADNPLVKKRNVVILFSIIPIIISVLLVIALMHLGYAINFSILLSFGTFIFVIVNLFNENKNDLFRFLVNIPFSKERAAYKQLNIRVIDYISKSQTDEKLSLKEMMAEIEKTFITNALEIKDGNHNLAAELLSTSISTIYRNKEREDKSDKIDKK